MSKFKIKMKLQGLELEIEGARDDMRLISQNLGQQMAGMLQPAGAIIEGDALHSPASNDRALIEESVRKKPRKRRQAGTNNGDGSDASSAIDWKHDSAKYGTPSQDWTATKKAMWLLYVANAETNHAELPSKVIADTFNKHFRPAGLVQAFNITRDLGKLRVKKGGPAPVGEDTTKNPSGWFLTDEGRKQVQKIISERLTETQTS